MGSIAARFRGPNVPGMPPFVALADSMKADIWGQGLLGAEFAPVQGSEMAGKFNLPKGLQIDRLQDRFQLKAQLDGFRRGLDVNDGAVRMDQYTQQALDMVVSGKAERAFTLDEESPALRDKYGRDSLGEKALLARRLVEAGVTFTVVSGRWGYFDHHGDNVPPWGGIEKGLKTHSATDRCRVAHADSRSRGAGLLDSTLVLMLGEFGRSPVMTKDAGREHWVNCMSMLIAAEA